MNESFIKGQGSGIVATTEFQLLDADSVQGATSFYYDFYLVGEDVAADAIWQIWDEAGVTDYIDTPGAVGVAGDGEYEWLKRVEMDANTLGKAQILVNAGTVGYWYILSSGAALPTTLQAEGNTSADVEFFVETNRTYTITSDGTHEWQYWDGSGWVAFDDGATNGFTFTAPAHRRIKLVPTGAVNFAITSFPLA